MKEILFLIVIFSIVNGQQQQQPNIGIAIDSIFGTSTQRIQTTRRRGGFDQIVTPEPNVDPTSEPQIFVNNGSRCICVPYNLCNPDNTIKSDGAIDGFGVIDIRFDSESCQDVLDVCCEDDRRQTTPINPPPLTDKPDRPQGCGIRNVGGIDFQITGNFNNEAGYSEFPWTVALIQISNDRCVCGGSLIHPQVVLTANHCLRNLIPGDLKVRAGEWDTQTTKERLPYQEQVTSQFISHPSFHNKSLANDIALVVLSQPFQLADNVNMICLPPQNYDSNGQQNCFASGWGKDVFGKAGKYSVIMKRVPLPIVPNDDCERSFQNTRLGPTFALSSTFICAGGQAGVDTCTGDGGAPLVCPVGNPSENRYAQNGIVSWGIGCKEARPAAYTNVALYRNWIDANMRQLGLGTSIYSY